jgi:hypothetical protein
MNRAICFGIMLTGRPNWRGKKITIELICLFNHIFRALTPIFSHQLPDLRSESEFFLKFVS